jgi:uncharacterized protein (TIGR02421 family)
MAQKSEARPEPDRAIEPPAPSSVEAASSDAAPAAVTGAATAPLREAVTAPANDAIPPSAPSTTLAPWRSYKEQVASIAQRIVDAQRPIRVLQALRWDPAVEDAFRRSKYRELPRVGPEEYAKIDLGFEPKGKIEEFEAIARAAESDLGGTDPIAKILIDTAIEYREVVGMLCARGTREFYGFSRKLYGSPKDAFPDGKTRVRDLGLTLYGILNSIDRSDLGPRQPADITAEVAAQTLNDRFSRYFHDTVIHVQVDDSLLADAAAGSDYVKIRSGARFSPRDIDILEAHEGWVHVATSLNGQVQPVAKWLAKGPPRTTAVQEGLAALLEMFTLRTYPGRARKLNDRILAVDKAEDGASFLEVFEWYRTEGYTEDECYKHARRVFRGGVLEGGAPFTKDSCYCKGIVLNYAFIRAALANRRPELVPFLFVGKVAHEDVPVLYARVADGVVRPPTYIPPMFADLNGLAIWTTYETFFATIVGSTVDDHYARLFARGDS